MLGIFLNISGGKGWSWRSWLGDGRRYIFIVGRIIYVKVGVGVITDG